ncbi:Drug resistance protein, partial [Lachnellula suecica]
RTNNTTSKMSSTHTSEVELDNRRQPVDNELSPAERTESKGGRQMSTFAEIGFICIIINSQLMTQAGLGQAIAPLRTIGASFGVENDPASLSWFPAAYSLTVGTFILIAGRLGDLYGHRRIFIAGWLWFALWTMLAGFAVYSNAIFFDCARAFQGMGPAFILPNGMAILGVTYEPGMKKNLMFAAFGAMAPLGFLVGAVITSLFAEFVWWPWGYWVIAMLCLLSAVGSIFLIPDTPSSAPDTTNSVWVKADVAGCITGVSGLVLINFAWNRAPTVGWQEPYVYVLLIVGIIFLVVFTQIEKRTKFPLVPFASMTADSTFLVGIVACGWASFGIWVYYAWQFIENLRGASPLLATAQFSPVAITGFLASGATGIILGKVPASVVMGIALSAFCISNILLATTPVDQTYWAQFFVSVLIMPFGMDMSFPAATLLLSNAMPREHQGGAASLVMTIVNYSISLALGFAGTVETHVNNGGKTKEDLLKGYRGAWYLSCGLAGLGIALTMVFGLYERRKIQRAKSVSSLQ